MEEDRIIDILLDIVEDYPDDSAEAEAIIEAVQMLKERTYARRRPLQEQH